MKMPDPGTLEALLAHGPWLRRLAGALVDASSADDLVQETWLQTLRNPPSLERSPRPWLSRVLRNRRFMQQRADTRRDARHERAAAPTEDAAVDDVVARAQQLRIVGELVEELDEPVRRVILLHFFEERTTAEIAAAEDIAPSTVRWRLKTGLERLRTTLDRRHDGDRRAWVAALAPGATVMKTTTKVLVLTTVLAASVTAVVAVTNTAAEPAKPVADEPPPATKPATAISRFEDRAARDRMVERIEEARRRREAAAAGSEVREHQGSGATRRPPPSPADAAPPDSASAPFLDEEREEAWGAEINDHLVPMLSECVGMAGGFKGDVGYDVSLVGEPDVGGVIDDVQVEGRNGTELDPAIADCFRETVYTLELPPPTNGGREVVSLHLSVDLPDAEDLVE